MTARTAAQAKSVARQASQAVLNQASQQIYAGLVKAYTKGIELDVEHLHLLVDAMQTPDDAAREQMFKRLAQLAQRDMVNSYAQKASRANAVPSYRSGSGRLSGGVLQRAISNQEFYSTSPDGISFGNVAFLDSEAKHWHRINFGALPRGEGSDAEFSVGDLGVLGLFEPPSSGFSMPPGYWLGTDGKVQHGQGIRGSGAFFPASGNSLASAIGKAGQRSVKRARPRAWRVTAGIEAANFMDAGIRSLARNIPKAYQEYINDIIEGAIKLSQSSSRSVTVVQGQVEGKSLSKISLP